MTNLSDEVKRVLELDAKRTQGEWLLESGEDEQLTLWVGSAIQERETGMYDSAGEIQLYDFPEPDAECKANATFIAAAPTMANIIRQQQALLVEAREALRGMNAIYDTDGDHSFADGDAARRKSRRTLTRLQAATME